MSVRQSLLAILAEGPCYGYQLRTEFDLRTGSAWPVNVGQVYNTLDRLERDKLVRETTGESARQKYFEITDSGRAEVGAWFATPVAAATAARGELAIKVALAMSLPSVDATAVLRTQQEATATALTAQASKTTPATSIELAVVLAARRDALEAEAELRWLDECSAAMAARELKAVPVSRELPRRGRPAKPAA